MESLDIKVVCFGSLPKAKNRSSKEIEVRIIPAVMVGLFLL
jgi:hypothetical protein